MQSTIMVNEINYVDPARLLLVSSYIRCLRWRIKRIKKEINVLATEITIFTSVEYFYLKNNF